MRRTSYRIGADGADGQADAASDHARAAGGIDGYKGLIDNSDDYMSALDEQGKLIFVNRKIVEGLGYSEEELLGRCCTHLVSEVDRDRCSGILQRARTFGMAIDSVHLLRKDGSTVPTYGSVTFDREHGIFEVAYRDVSHRLRMEEELRRRAELLEAQNETVLKAIAEKDRFCRVVSHELRTPLTSIIGFTEMLVEDDDDPLTTGQRVRMERVAESAHRLLDMVNGLLDLSRLDARKVELELSRVKLDRFVAHVVDGLRPLARDKKLEIKVDIAPNVPQITTDKLKLDQILVNLISNAVKFTSEGSVTIAAALSDGSVLISVKDTGVGIPAPDLPHVFEEFHRVATPGQRHPGTGLGLAIAQKLAMALGGEISVRSRADSGSTFTLRLPMTPDPALDRILQTTSLGK